MHPSTRPTEKKIRFFIGKSVWAIIVCDGRSRTMRRRAGGGRTVANEAQAGGGRDSDVLAGGEDRVVAACALGAEERQRGGRTESAVRRPHERRTRRVHVLEVEYVGGERASQLEDIEAWLAIAESGARQSDRIEPSSGEDEAAGHGAMVLQTIANNEICVILTIRRGP